MSSQEEIPHGWIKVKSKSRNKYYFFHKEKKISVWKLSDCADESKIPISKDANVFTSPVKTPKKTPKKESKISNHSINIGKKNLALERLKKLQTTLRNELKNTNPKAKPNKEIIKPESTQTSSEKKVQSIIPKGTKNGTLKNSKPPENSQIVPNIVKENDLNSSKSVDVDESVEMEIDEMLDKSTESLKDYQEEPMEWEDIDEKFVVQEVHNVRTKENFTNSSTFSGHRDNKRLSESDFYIIVDTNVLLSNLQFVKQIKGKAFKDIGNAHIFLPYIVLCELDRLKSREESISRLARGAISYIDDCFKAKDEFFLGQNAIESSRELIEIDSGDDYIINCALQLKETIPKIILLSNDKNLRNKAFVNGIEGFSSDTLNYADYNVSNSIRFE